MCLIIYSESGKLPTRADFFEAAECNPDGIGIMSTDGVHKFIGKRKTRRAWRYLQQIASDGAPFGVHFRWATHGRVSRENCHPFPIGDSDAYLMHNGILWTHAMATDDKSDTAVFAAEVAPAILSLAYSDRAEYLQKMGREAASNRLLIMRDAGRAFDVVNPYLWTKDDGILYSNDYSIGRMAMVQRGPYSGAKSSGKYQQSKAGWLAGPLSRGYGYGYDPDDNLAFPGSWEDDAEADLWQQDFDDAMACGYMEDDAERYATLEASKRAREAREEYRRGERGGFDWHDRATWDKYPIPGTYADRVLNRHGDGERGDYDAPDARDMFV